MRIGRLEFGRWKSDKPMPWSFMLDHAHCGCHILDLGPLYFTWLGDECYGHIKRKR